MAKRNKGSISEAAKARQAKSKELAKKYRHEAAELKKKGVLTSRVNARKNISRHTRTKINKFRDVLEGKAIPVRVPKDIRARYRDKGMLNDPDFISERGAFLMVPAPYKNMKAKLERGDKIRVTRHLKNGAEEYVIFPYSPHDLPGIVETLQSDPTIDGLKYEDELFSFRLNGHNANETFINAKEMSEYLTRYVPNNIVTLTFQRFKPMKNTSSLRNPNEGSEEKLYTRGYEPGGRRRRYDPSGRDTWNSKRQAATQAERKRKQRAKETDEQRAARKERDKLYQRDKRRYGNKRDR